MPAELHEPGIYKREQSKMQFISNTKSQKSVKTCQVFLELLGINKIRV